MDAEKQRQVEEFCVDKMATLIEKFNPNEYERNYLKEQIKKKLIDKWLSGLYT